MTDCIHNEKRTCLKERLEMVAEIERLKGHIRDLGGMSGICTYNDLNEICTSCRCHRSPIKEITNEQN